MTAHTQTCSPTSHHQSPPSILPPITPIPPIPTTPGEHVILNLDMTSVHGPVTRMLAPGDPLAEMAFFSETSNLQARQAYFNNRAV